MCAIWDAENPILYSQTFPKARKEHICCECASIISIGETYEYISGLWENFKAFKTCSFCASIRVAAIRDYNLSSNESFPFESLWECIGYDYKLKEK